MLGVDDVASSICVALIFGTGCSTSLTAALGANYATFKDGSMHGRAVDSIETRVEGAYGFSA